MLHRLTHALALEQPLPSQPPRLSLANKSITVFVGNISTAVPDAVLREMLNKCGTVLHWKRVKGATGELQGVCCAASHHAEHTAVLTRVCVMGSLWVL